MCKHNASCVVIFTHVLFVCISRGGGGGGRGSK